MWDETDLPFGVRSKAFIQKQSKDEKAEGQPGRPLSEPTHFPTPETPASFDPALEQNWEAARSLHQQAIRHHRNGSHQDAERDYRGALQLLETIPRPDRLEQARLTNNLGRVLHDQQKYEEAEQQYKRSIQILETLLPPGHPKIAKRLTNLAALYRSQGRDAEAEQISRKLAPDIQD